MLPVNHIKSLNPILLIHAAVGTILKVISDYVFQCLPFFPDCFVFWVNCFFINSPNLHYFKKFTETIQDGDKLVSIESVQVCFRNFGRVNLIEYSNVIFKIESTLYTNILVQQLVDLAYVNDVSIKAAQFDFRIGMSKL